MSRPLYYRVEVYHAKSFDRQWYFRVVSGNGKIVAQSEGYKRKGMCMKTAMRFLTARFTISEVEES